MLCEMMSDEILPALYWHVLEGKRIESWNEDATGTTLRFSVSGHSILY
jgi:hypothetical protein